MVTDIRGRRDGRAGVCWHVRVMPSRVSAVMRRERGRWDIGDGNTERRR